MKEYVICKANLKSGEPHIEFSKGKQYRLSRLSSTAVQVFGDNGNSLVIDLIVFTGYFEHVPARDNTVEKRPPSCPSIHLKQEDRDYIMALSGAKTLIGAFRWMLDYFRSKGGVDDVMRYKSLRAAVLDSVRQLEDAVER